MNTVLAIVFFVATDTALAADTYLSNLQQKQHAQAIRLAKLLADNQAMLAQDAVIDQERRESVKSSEAFWERAAEEKRLVAARVDGAKHRAEWLARKGGEARRAAEGRCLGVESSPK